MCSSANARYRVAVVGAVDVSGNTQTDAFESSFATIDTVAPALTLAAPEPGAWVATAQPNVRFAMSDVLSGLALDTITLGVDGELVPAEELTVEDDAFTWTPASELSDGTHELVAAVADRAGNVTTTTESIGIDTVAPDAPSLVGLSEGRAVRGAFTFEASAVDGTSGGRAHRAPSDGRAVRELTGAGLSASARYDTAPRRVRGLFGARGRPGRECR